jgi:hypothetical protein
MTEEQDMAYHVTTLQGSDEANVSPERMAAVLASLDQADDEHPDVSLAHETDWSMAVFPSGLVVFENLETGPPMHMRGVSRARALELWQQLARGEVEALRALPWEPGYGVTGG